MSGLRGTTIQLLEPVQSGSDALNVPVYDYVTSIVQGVLVSHMTGEDVTDAQQIAGVREVCWVHIPRGDTHTWEHSKAVIHGKEWRAVGPQVCFDERMTPGPWTSRIQMERDETWQ